MQATNPPFKEEILSIIHKLVDLPISHGLIARMKQLEHLLTHFEAREFTYYDHRDLIVSRNCMLALWMYLLKNIDQISVLKYQDIAYRMIRALLMRKEFYLSNLGYSAESPNDPFENQTEDEAKCCRVYRKLLVETFLYAAELLPIALSDTSTYTSPEMEKQLKEKATEKTLQTAKNGGFRVSTDSSEADRPSCVRRFCTMVFAFAFLRIPAIQGPVIESLTWRLMNQEQLMESVNQIKKAGGSSQDKDGDEDLDKPGNALREAIKMPKARKLVDLHAKFINSNPHLFAWSALASPDDNVKAVPEDPSWLYSLGRDGMIFVEFFLQLTRQVLEVAKEANGQGAIGEKKDIPWLSLPGYSLFVELYAPLLGFSMTEAVNKAAGLHLKKDQNQTQTPTSSSSLLKELPPAPSTYRSAPTSWIDKFAPQDQPKPSMFQINQIMEMGFTRAQAIVALMHTATVSSAYLDNASSGTSSGNPPPKYMMDASRAVEFALVEDMRKMVDDLGGEEEVEKSYDEARHLMKRNTSQVTSEEGELSKAVIEEEEDVPDLIDFSALSDFSETSSPPVEHTPVTQDIRMENTVASTQLSEDEETLAFRSKVEAMELEKSKAVREEDYMRAGQIKQFITDLTTAENLRLQLKAQLLEEEAQRKSQLLNDEVLLFGSGLDDEGPMSKDGNQLMGNVTSDQVPTSDDGWFADGTLGSTDLLVKSLHEEAQHISGSTPVDTNESLSPEVTRDDTLSYSPTNQERSQDWANRMKAAAMSYLSGKDDGDLELRRKALNDAVVVGSGVVLGNPSLLGLHLSSLLTSLHRLPKETSLVATPFTLEVAARWFHQSSTRKLAMLGTIQVKIWVLPMSALEIDAFIDEFEALLVNALDQDEKERAGGAATKALKQMITFLYHNIDLIHGPPRHRFMKMILSVAFMRMFINKSKEVMYGFHLLMVYKLLRFHRHHAGSSNDLDLLTTIGAKLLSMDQSHIMQTMQEVANRKTSAADPWKGMVEVEELDIDRALQSHAHVLIDLIRESPKKNVDTSEEEALKLFNANKKKEKIEETFDLLQVEDQETSDLTTAASKAEEPQQVQHDISVPTEGLSLVEAALANYSRNLWEYYVSGLKQKNDAALSVFAPPLVFGKAHDAFNPPRRLFVPGVSAPSGFTVYNPATGSLNLYNSGTPHNPIAPPGPPPNDEINNGLGRRIQNTPYSDGTTS